MTVTASAPPRASALGRAYRLSVDDYHRMGESGILGGELRTELIDGEIIEMPPIGHPHAGTVNLLVKLLISAVGDQAVVAPQNPVYLDDHTEPLPDIALLLPRADYYRNAHAGPDDVLLLIEVADSSLAYDRDVKLPRYARAGIPEAWLVDLSGRRLWVHRQAHAARCADITQPDDLAAVAVPVAAGAKVYLDLRALF